MSPNLPAAQASGDDSLPSSPQLSESSLHPIGYHRFRAEDELSERLARVIVAVVFTALCIDWEPVLTWWLP